MDVSVDLTPVHRRRLLASRANTVISYLLFLPVIQLALKPWTCSVARIEVGVALLAVVIVLFGRRIATPVALAIPHLISNELLDLELFLIVPPILIAGGFVCSLAATIDADLRERKLQRIGGLVRIPKVKHVGFRGRTNRKEVVLHFSAGMGLAAAAMCAWWLMGELIEHRLAPRVLFYGAGGLLSLSAWQFYKYVGALSRGIVADGRPSILVLRSFRADPAVQQPAGDATDDFRTVADSIVTSLWDRGRVITVGNQVVGLPGEYFANLETSKQWQDDIRREAAAARFIVVLVDASPSLRWEIDLVSSTKALREKALFIWAQELPLVDTLFTAIAQQARGADSQLPAEPPNLRALRFMRDDSLLLIAGPRKPEVFDLIADRYVVETGEVW